MAALELQDVSLIDSCLTMSLTLQSSILENNVDVAGRREIKLLQRLAFQSRVVQFEVSPWEALHFTVNQRENFTTDQGALTNVIGRASSLLCESVVNGRIHSVQQVRWSKSQFEDPLARKVDTNACLRTKISFFDRRAKAIRTVGCETVLGAITVAAATGGAGAGASRR